MTCPPRGASSFGKAAPWPYAAGILAESVAGRLGFPFALTLSRTAEKKTHGVHQSLAQTGFKFEMPQERPDMILVCDDLVTTGTTLRLSLAAIRGAGFPAFAFAFSGHGRGGG